LSSIAVVLHAGIIYFSYKGEPLRCKIGRTGKLNLKQVAGYFGLDSSTVRFNDEIPLRADEAGLSQRPVLGGYSEDDPVIITGLPLAGKQAQNPLLQIIFSDSLSQ